MSFIALTLAACGQNSKIENAVRATLKDPQSAQFRNFLVSKGGTIACVGWNSKNSLGGYGDWDTAHLKKGEAGWVVTDMQVREETMHLCTQEGMDSSESTVEMIRKLTQ